MKNWIIALAALATTHTGVLGQVSYGGSPAGAQLAAVEVRLPAVNTDSLMAADILEEEQNLPFRFGQPVNLDLSPDRIPEAWSELPDGSRVWKIEIWSPGAYSLNFIFDVFRLKTGAEMYIYTPDMAFIRGKFDVRNVREHGKLGVAPLPGDRAVIEFRLLPGVPYEGTPFVLGSAVHGYKDVFFNKSQKGFGDSGSCNINVNCPQGADWQNAKKGVAMILNAGGSRLCTGSMINDVPQSGTPYFLTADHCHGNDVATWVFMFNYESPSCANVDGPTNQTVSGCAVRARYAASDVMLLELNSRPQDFYDVWYNGWNNVDQAAPQSVIIHHPRGDIKKITFENDPLVSSDYGSGGGNSHWATGSYEAGTTEPGSSGSPIFNLQQQIVGQLHGGPASCTSLTEDYYGKVAVSWNGGGTNATRLSNWLDPEGTGATEVPGGLNADPVANLSANKTTGFTGPGCPPFAVNFTAQAVNLDPPFTSITWNFPGGTPANSANSLTPPAVIYANPGVYDVSVEICNAETCIVKNRPAYINVIGMINALPFVETFENETSLWEIVNPDNGLTWDFRTVQGSTPGNRAAYMPFYNYTGSGQRDGLVSPVFDFTGFESVSLRFDYAYPQSSAFVQARDSLIVYYSTNCGQTWQRVWARAEGAATPFSTAPAPTWGAFVPQQASHWCHSTNITGVSCPELAIPQLAGTAGVRFKFEGFNRYGNNLYLDNINVTGIETCTLAGNITAPTGEFCMGDVVNLGFEGNASVNAQYQWTADGGSIIGGAGDPTVQIRRNDAGSVVVGVRVASDGCIFESQRELVFRGVSAVFSAQPNTACAGDTVVVQFTGTSEQGVTYEWDFGLGSVVSGQEGGPYRVVWNEGGDWPVKLITRVGECESQSVRIVRVRKPDARFVISAENACVGEPVLVSIVGSVGADEHVWDFGGATVQSGSGAGPYVVVFDNPGDKSLSHLAVVGPCTAQFSRGISIQAFPSLSHEYDEPIFVFRVRDTVVVSAQSNGQWTEWDFDGGTVVENISETGTSAFRVTWTTLGTKDVAVVAGNGSCATDTLRFTVIVTEWTRRGDPEREEPKVYPQPAAGVLTLFHPNPAPGKAVLLDAAGREVVNVALPAGTARELSLKDVPAGVYSLRLTLSTGERFERAVVVGH